MGSGPLTGGSGCASIQTTATWNQDLHNWGGGGLSVGKYRPLWYRLASSDRRTATGTGQPSKVFRPASVPLWWVLLWTPVHLVHPEGTEETGHPSRGWYARKWGVFGQNCPWTLQRDGRRDRRKASNTELQLGGTRNGAEEPRQTGSPAVI